RPSTITPDQRGTAGWRVTPSAPYSGAASWRYFSSAGPAAYAVVGSSAASTTGRSSTLGERRSGASTATRSSCARVKRSPLRRVTPERGRRGGAPRTTGPARDRDERRTRRTLAQHDLHEVTAGVQEPGVVRLGEVVVAPPPPEPRYDGHPPLPLEAARQRDGRQRLIDGVEWPGEEPRLLAGRDDQHVARREPIARRPPAGERGGDHVRRHPPRREPRRGERERCDRRCHYPRNHPSPFPLPASRPSPNTSA